MTFLNLRPLLQPLPMQTFHIHGPLFIVCCDCRRIRCSLQRNPLKIVVVFFSWHLDPLLLAPLQQQQQHSQEAGGKDTEIDDSDSGSGNGRKPTEARQTPHPVDECKTTDICCHRGATANG
jgi:hypothetical protein